MSAGREIQDLDLVAEAEACAELIRAVLDSAKVLRAVVGDEGAETAKERYWMARLHAKERMTTYFAKLDYIMVRSDQQSSAGRRQ